MKRSLSFVIALIAVLAMSIPVHAANVDTSVTVTNNGGTAPVVKALWQYNAGTNVTAESGDPSHAVQGVQIAPATGFQQQTDITFVAIVTDAAGVANINHVYADVFYPGTGTVDPGPNGALKFELELTRDGQNDFNKALFDAANAAHMVTINSGAVDPSYGVPITPADIDTELDQQMAAIYRGTFHFDVCQLAGIYSVAINSVNKQSQIGTFAGVMTWSAVTAAEFDFNAVNYGNVTLGVHKQIGGDRVWDSPIGANKATIRNIGNTYLQMTVKEDDLGLGQTQPGNIWNVHFDARLGDGIGEPNNGYVNYDPAVVKGGNLAGATATVVPQILKLCALEKVDFSIQVDKDLTPGTPKTGAMIVGAVVNAGPPTNPK